MSMNDEERDKLDERRSELQADIDQLQHEVSNVHKLPVDLRRKELVRLRERELALRARNDELYPPRVQ